MLPDDLPFDLVVIGEVIRRHQVRCVVIGGASGTFHGMVEYRTKDVDLLVHDSVDNLERLALALNELGAVPAGTADRQPIAARDLAMSSTQWDTAAGPVDILVSAAGPNDTIVVCADLETSPR